MLWTSDELMHFPPANDALSGVPFITSVREVSAWIDNHEFQCNVLVKTTADAVLFACKNLRHGIPSGIRWVVFGRMPPTLRCDRVERIYRDGRLWVVHWVGNQYRAQQLSLFGEVSSFYMEGTSREDLDRAISEMSVQ